MRAATWLIGALLFLCAATLIVIAVQQVQQINGLTHRLDTMQSLMEKQEVRATAPSPKWEYRVETPPDEIFSESINALGVQGWELVASRRAKSGYDMAYEMVFRRQLPESEVQTRAAELRTRLLKIAADAEAKVKANELLTRPVAPVTTSTEPQG